MNSPWNKPNRNVRRKCRTPLPNFGNDCVYKIRSLSSSATNLVEGSNQLFTGRWWTFYFGWRLGAKATEGRAPQTNSSCWGKMNFSFGWWFGSEPTEGRAPQTKSYYCRRHSLTLTNSTNSRDSRLIALTTRAWCPPTRKTIATCI